MVPMVSPIYDLYPSIGITKPTFPSAKNSTLDSGAVNGIGTDHIVTEDKEKAAPKNPPSTWSSGPDQNDYLAND